MPRRDCRKSSRPPWAVAFDAYVKSMLAWHLFGKAMSPQFEFAADLREPSRAAEPRLRPDGRQAGLQGVQAVPGPTTIC